MRGLKAVLFTLCLMCGGGEVAAGGFPIDPRQCPTGSWFPEPPIPQEVTETLCLFLLSLDDGDEERAYRLLSRDFASEMSLQEFRGAFAGLQQSGSYSSDGVPERYVMSVVQQGDVYGFSIQVFGGSRGYEEHIYIGDNGVVGLRIGN